MKLSADGELGMKIGFTAGEKDDRDGSLLVVGELRAVDVGLRFVRIRIGDGERSGTLNLNAVMERCTRGNGFRTEAGAGVIDFEEMNGRAGLILDVDFDVIGTASGKCER